MKVKITLKLESSEVSKASELIALVRSFPGSTVEVGSPEKGSSGVAGSGVGVGQDRAVFRERCATLLTALGNTSPDENDPVARAAVLDIHSKICALLEATPFSSEAVDDFFSVFVHLAFSVERVKKNLTVLPFMTLLPRLPEAYRVEMRTRILQTVIQNLNQRRPVDANRTEFFAYAEAFAALVKLEFVNIDGAINTIYTLLRIPETRCAGVTMFGKTVELCLPLITGKCDATQLANLRSALALATEENFQYDVNYIEENMSWHHSLQHPTSAVQQQQLQEHSGVSMTPTSTTTSPAIGEHPMGHFVCTGKFTGHKDIVYTLSYDHSSGILISGSHDSIIRGWDTAGNVVGQTELHNLYACSADVNPRSHSLYVCGWPQEDASVAGTVPSLVLYTLGSSDDGGSTDGKKFFQCQGMLGSDVSRESRAISCVRALVQDQGVHFATGELLSGQNAGTVRIYDENAAPFSKLQPLVSFQEHTSYITTLASHPSSEGLVFSGSYDGTIKMWDIRQPKSATTIEIVPGTDRPQAPPEKGMVTCVHAQGCVLAAGMVDSSLRLWDIRKLDVPLFQMTVDKNPVLKVSISPLSSSTSPIVAVSTNTNSGLFMAFPAYDKIIPSEPVVSSGDPCVFYDLSWGERDEYGNPLLYAAGSELRLYSTQWDS